MRNSVDANPYISASLLEKLAGYKIYLVRYDVAKNPTHLDPYLGG